MLIISIARRHVGSGLLPGDLEPNWRRRMPIIVVGRHSGPGALSQKLAPDEDDGAGHHMGGGVGPNHPNPRVGSPTTHGGGGMLHPRAIESRHQLPLRPCGQVHPCWFPQGGQKRLLLGAADDGHLALVLGPANLLLWYGSELVFADKLDRGHPEYRSLPNGVKSFPYRVLE